MVTPTYTRADFDDGPFVVFYEVTQACDLACRHCRASAQTQRHREELSTSQSMAVIEQLGGFAKSPLLVFTGGDPLKRDDIHRLIQWAGDVGLQTAMTPSATPLVTPEAIRRMRDAGLGRLAVSLDGVDARTHDAFRGVDGIFEYTMQIMADARRLGMPLQVNTTITQRNVNQLDAMADLLATQGIGLWSVFFLIPVGRGATEQRISAEQFEQVFARLWRHAQQQPYAIKTTEGHHYRRFVLQRGGDPQNGVRRGNKAGKSSRPSPPAPSARPALRAPLGVNDGKGVLFIGHTGQVFPSGFLPIRCGRVPDESIVEIYQRSPVFRRLRDADQLHGKCGVCQYRHVCGGSRARSWAVTGDYMASEPDCVYEPKRAATSV